MRRRLVFLPVAIILIFLIFASFILGFFFTAPAWIITGEGENGWFLTGWLVDLWDRIDDWVKE